MLPGVPPPLAIPVLTPTQASLFFKYIKFFPTSVSLQGLFPRPDVLFTSLL